MMEDPEIGFCCYNYCNFLIFDKGVKIYVGEKTASLTNGAGEM
jgi:hypothetical protein